MRHISSAYKCWALRTFHSQQGRCYHCPHLADEETEACRGPLTWPRQQLLARTGARIWGHYSNFRDRALFLCAHGRCRVWTQKPVCDTLPRQPSPHTLKNMVPADLEVSKGEESPTGPGFRSPLTPLQTRPRGELERKSLTGVSQPLACHICSVTTTTELLSYFSIGWSGNTCTSGKVALSILSRKLLQLWAE